MGLLTRTLGDEVDVPTSPDGQSWSSSSSGSRHSIYENGEASPSTKDAARIALEGLARLGVLGEGYTGDPVWREKEKPTPEQKHREGLSDAIAGPRDIEARSAALTAKLGVNGVYAPPVEEFLVLRGDPNVTLGLSLDAVNHRVGTRWCFLTFRGS